jgi:undecaprenyl-diphosphatase
LDILKAIVLGVIQGLTEFLPISSTAHLTIAGKFMGMIDPLNPEHWTASIAVIQLGTLIAVFAYFIKDIYKILIDFFSDLTKRITGNPPERMTNETKLGWLIIIGTIPVGLIGLFFRKIIEGTLTKNLYVIAASMIILAIILWIAEITGKRKREMEQITLWDSLFIGFAESLALIPGSSRSGTTITGGLFVGLTRQAAAKFSFLLSLPAVLASGLLELKESLKDIPHAPIGAGHLIIATVVSAIVGYISIWFLLNYLKKHSTGIFIIYRIVIGIFILILLSTKLITN